MSFIPVFGTPIIESLWNSVRFVISKEDLTSGPGTRADHSRVFL